MCGGSVRNVVAEKTSDKFYKHYLELSSADTMFSSGNEREEYFKKYNAKTEEFIKQNLITVEIANFLYQSDCEGQIDRKQAKQIYELIKECDDNISFGYTGRSDCTKMADMKKIFSDRTKVKWC